MKEVIFMSYCLAIDIGASSGRHLLGELRDGKLVCEEVYRFENGMKKEGSSLLWDTDSLVSNVISGLRHCKEIGKIPETVAIDTWGVDYVLLDKRGREISPAYAYRDSRTSKIPEEVFEIIPQEKLYAKTGIQKQDYNSIFQIYCDKKAGRLDSAKSLLFMPCYLSYKLTGVMKNEYTIATTSGLVNAKTKTWDGEILEKLGISESLLGEIILPSTELGELSQEVAKEVGFNCKVVLCPSHDTASAVAACPVNEKSVFISSGTWSLVGTENLYPVTDEGAMKANFSNEGGINYRYRFLKNIMGMWLFQSIRKDTGKKYSYDEMMEMAMSSSFTEKIDPTSEAFLAPDNMIEAIRAYLGKPELPLGDVLSSVYHSLAASYDKTVKEIEEISGKTVDTVSIVGGGCKDRYLNSLTKKYTGKRVTAGPVEGTALGNMLSQLMYTDPGLTLEAARKIIINTFDIKEV
ncbi:MAG: rhamnulokinase [Ruminococcaceae bacterium]|nr:rhamnulokinase [Oscillospiraceae bacterium]